jgi:hypothetical protein
MGSSITSTPVATLLILQNPDVFIWKNCKLLNMSSKGQNLLALFAEQSHHGLPLCTWFPKKMDRGGLVAHPAKLHTSLNLAFCQTGAQHLVGDVSTGNFCPIVCQRKAPWLKKEGRLL